ncbi:MAG: nucleoside triphosphate pyrophosphatase [Pseudobdellovibrionaceae bacterium]
MTQLVLASTSPYRKELIEKLGLPFIFQAPKCDEEALKGKIRDPIELASTLAQAKAQSLSQPDNCVIGGDQVVAFGSEILGKPLTFENAFAQLQKMQGSTHRLITSVHVINKGQPHAILDVTEIEMRKLTSEQIEAYLKRDEPFDCAGSYKIEKSGLVLLKQVRSQDFSAIEGVPLIRLTQLLSDLGYSIPGSFKA